MTTFTDPVEAATEALDDSGSAVTHAVWLQLRTGAVRGFLSAYPARSRTRAEGHSALDESNIVAHLKLVAKVSNIVSPSMRLRLIADDPDDDRILECAIAGKEDLIVSGDHHLRKLKNFRNVGIVRPGDLLLRILA